MNERTNNELISWLLLQVIQMMKHRLHAVAEEYELTVMQLSAFMVLTPERMLPMSALSQQLACDASSITGIVDRLEARKLVERRDSPIDRRLKMVMLTQAGEALQGRIMTELAELEDARLKPLLSAAEQTELRRLLGKLLEAGKPAEVAK